METCWNLFGTSVSTFDSDLALFEREIPCQKVYPSGHQVSLKKLTDCDSHVPDPNLLQVKNTAQMQAPNQSQYTPRTVYNPGYTSREGGINTSPARPPPLPPAGNLPGVQIAPSSAGALYTQQHAAPSSNPGGQVPTTYQQSYHPAAGSTQKPGSFPTSAIDPLHYKATNAAAAGGIQSQNIQPHSVASAQTRNTGINPVSHPVYIGNPPPYKAGPSYINNTGLHSNSGLIPNTGPNIGLQSNTGLHSGSNYSSPRSSISYDSKGSSPRTSIVHTGPVGLAGGAPPPYDFQRHGSPLNSSGPSPRSSVSFDSKQSSPSTSLIANNSSHHQVIYDKYTSPPSRQHGFINSGVGGELNSISEAQDMPYQPMGVRSATNNVSLYNKYNESSSLAPPPYTDHKFKTSPGIGINTSPQIGINTNNNMNNTSSSPLQQQQQQQRPTQLGGLNVNAYNSPKHVPHSVNNAVLNNRGSANISTSQHIQHNHSSSAPLPNQIKGKE